MSHIFAFISGFLLCAALWLLRERERAKVFNTACEIMDTYRAKEARYHETLAYLRQRIREIRRDLGGQVTPPATAMRSNGRQLFLARRTSPLEPIHLEHPTQGPLTQARPHLFGRSHAD